MKNLELKIFDLLAGKITASEFENWLYNSKEHLDLTNTNPLVYDLITLNYNNKNWLDIFEKKLLIHFSKNSFMMFLSINTYSKLLKAESLKKSLNTLNHFMQYFDNNFNSHIEFDLYLIWCEFDLYDNGVYDENELNHIIKTKSKDVLSQFNLYEKLEEKLDFFNQENVLENNIFNKEKRRNSTLKQKIFAFFKKS